MRDYPKSKGKDNVLVVVDRFTKFTHFIDLAHPYTAQEVARAFMDRMVALYGVPRFIISNRGKIFTGTFW